MEESEQLPAIFQELSESVADGALGIGRKERDDEGSASMRDALFHAAPALAKLKASFWLVVRLGEMNGVSLLHAGSHSSNQFDLGHCLLVV